MRLLILLILSFGILSCSERNDHQKSFFANYSNYCGYAYKGQTNFVDLGSSEVFDGADLKMILRDCSDDEVRIPFHVDDDTSRTWIVKMTQDGLHMSHDHRYDDGTEHENNFYGGYSDDEGNAFLQYFPADERTIEERPARSANRWAKEFDLSEMKYYYRLYLNDELRFEAEFDLVNPIEINP